MYAAMFPLTGFPGAVDRLLMGLTWAFTGVHPTQWLLYFALMTCISVVFAAIGLVQGLRSESFDQLAMPTTFFITPLVFFGGVFSSVHALPERLVPFALTNPIFYLIDGFRATFTGHTDAPLSLDLFVLALALTAALAGALILFQRGYKLRT